ncbi:MAG: preprotein translocase subunit YajC [Hyphomicrobiales bacterium]|nr:preprotein translocase subunit YajC [Hyphomicrobiales bacterium]MCP5374415.1 preprotein translocase subunit YajC [Hyphomicrobiales bacterium]
MFVSPAYAQAAGGGGGAGGLEALLPLILIFVVFYFLLIRPQQKKMKQHKEMLGTIRRGDKIVTGGGIIATVTKVVNDDEVMAEIAEGVKVRIQRATVAAVLTKTEPAPAAKDDKAAADGQDGGTGGGDAPAGPAGKLKGLFGGKK